MRRDTYERLQEQSRREDYNRRMRRNPASRETNAQRDDFAERNYNRPQNLSGARSGYNDRDDSGENERGWFEKASDEVSSWFGGDDANNPRRTNASNRGNENEYDGNNIHSYQAGYTPKEANPFYPTTNRIYERDSGDDSQNRRNDFSSSRRDRNDLSSQPQQRNFYPTNAARGGGGGGEAANRNFLGNQPQQQQQQNRWRDWHDTRAGDMMTRNVSTVRPQDTAQHAARLMRDEDCGALPVVDGRGRMVGMVTDRDITIRLVADGADPRFARVEDCMTDEQFACHVNDPIEGCMRSMKEHQVRRIVIVDDDRRVVGILSQGDLARHAEMNKHRGERHAFTDMMAEISEQSNGAYR
jgi:CBS domain-containing protein